MAKTLKVDALRAAPFGKGSNNSSTIAETVFRFHFSGGTGGITKTDEDGRDAIFGGAGGGSCNSSGAGGSGGTSLCWKRRASQRRQYSWRDGSTPGGGGGGSGIKLQEMAVMASAGC